MSSNQPEERGCHQQLHQIGAWVESSSVEGIDELDGKNTTEGKIFCYKAIGALRGDVVLIEDR